MSGITALATRNVAVFLRDRPSVAFSLMAVAIVIALYVLFLRDNLVSTYPELPGAGNLMDAWVMSGILAIVPVTASAGILQSLVEDRSSGRIRDLMMTPLSPWDTAVGYLLGTFASSFALSVLAEVVCVAFLAATGCPLSAVGILTTTVLLVPSSLVASAVLYAMTCMFRSPGAFSGMFVTVSVMIGFLTGVYMPMGSMPSAMQTVSALVPASHFASLFRDGLAGGALDASMAGATDEVLSEFRSDMGFDLSVGGFGFGAASSLLYCALIGVVALAASALYVSRRRA
ncbi:MAG: ABC transporter permease [Candidatus Methanomethylophilaceae archaeon]|nr:ABC transporter permease [Candidatus Methanomethylophilaceae archaeon]